MNIASYISNSYNILKERNKILSYKVFHEFDEDIYHNTLCNCLTKDNNFETDDDIHKYVWISFKNNIMRDKKYKYHCLLKNELSDNMIILSNDDPEFEHDKKLLFEEIIEKFGNTLYDLFEQHMSGISIIKLQSEHLDIKNLKQKIKNIKIYIKNFRDA